MHDLGGGGVVMCFIQFHALLFSWGRWTEENMQTEKCWHSTALTNAGTHSTCSLSLKLCNSSIILAQHIWFKTLELLKKLYIKQEGVKWKQYLLQGLQTLHIFFEKCLFCQFDTLSLFKFKIYRWRSHLSHPIRIFEWKVIKEKLSLQNPTMWRAKFVFLGVPPGCSLCLRCHG